VAIAAAASPYGLDLRDDSHAATRTLLTEGLPSLPSAHRNSVLRRLLESGQFVSLAFGQACAKAGIARSMGSRGDCWDNAVAESFFATLKKELIRRQSWPTKQQLRTAVFDYIRDLLQRYAPTLDARDALAAGVRDRDPEPRRDELAGCAGLDRQHQDQVGLTTTNPACPPNRGTSKANEALLGRLSPIFDLGLFSSEPGKDDMDAFLSGSSVCDLRSCPATRSRIP
jgi:hypothetical protein